VSVYLRVKVAFEVWTE